MMLGIVFGSLCLLIFIAGTVIHEKMNELVSKRKEVSEF